MNCGASKTNNIDGLHIVDLCPNKRKKTTTKNDNRRLILIEGGPVGHALSLVASIGFFGSTKRIAKQKKRRCISFSIFS